MNWQAWSLVIIILIPVAIIVDMMRRKKSEDEYRNNRIKAGQSFFKVGDRVRAVRDGRAGLFMIRKDTCGIVTEILIEEVLISLDGFPLELIVHTFSLDFFEVVKEEKK